jgi:ferredoxin
MIDGLCYEKCPSGYKYNTEKLPTYCIPNDYKGAFYNQTDRKPLYSCPSDAESVNGFCYKKCPSGYTRDSNNPFLCKK